MVIAAEPLAGVLHPDFADGEAMAFGVKPVADFDFGGVADDGAFFADGPSLHFTEPVIFDGSCGDFGGRRFVGIAGAIRMDGVVIVGE